MMPMPEIILHLRHQRTVARRDSLLLAGVMLLILPYDGDMTGQFQFRTAFLGFRH